jgi:putative ABC transport system permease protein
MIKYWRYTLINIGGLALGLASFLFISLYIGDELSYDRFHQNAHRIYRVNRWYNTQAVNEDAATCSFPCGPAIEADYPHLVEKMVRIFDFQVPEMLFEYQATNDTIRFNEPWFYLADSSIFDIFTFEFVRGDSERPLYRPNTLVICESAARRYFGDESPIGKTLRLEEYVDMEVTAVIRDLPNQSHMKIEMLGSLSTYRMLQGKNAPDLLLGPLTRYRQLKPNRYPETWVWNPCWTYIMLREGVQRQQLENRFHEFYLRHYAELQNQNVTLYLQPLTEIHLHSDHAFEMQKNSQMSYIHILSVIALVILFLACINFMNLTTATSYTRAREIGMKKVFGGTRTKLVYQFLGETLLQTTMALILASFLVEFSLPAFNQLTDKNIQGLFSDTSFILPALPILLVFISFTAGLYPAFCLSGYQPVALFKSQSVASRKSLNPRKLLVTGQFIISTSLIITSLLAFNQLKFLRRANLGFQKDHIVIFKSAGALNLHYQKFKESLLKYSDIESVTGMEDILGVNHNTRAYQIEGLEENKPVYIPTFLVEWDFIETFQIRMLEGRSFSRDFPDDNTRAVVINQKLAQSMGWTNKQALGKSIRSQYGDEHVIGVCSDFHVLSLHHPLNKFIIDMYTRPEEFARVIAVRTRGTDLQPTLEHIRNQWSHYNPTRPLQFQLLENYLDQQYSNEARFGRFSSGLTILALIIAAIGMTGLASFYAEQKHKEITLRKVHGASLPNIQNLMFREFLNLILLSNLVAWPLAWLFAQKWLQSYAQHTTISLWIFLLAGLITFSILSVIVFIRTRKSYRANPAEVLKHQG